MVLWLLVSVVGLLRMLVVCVVLHFVQGFSRCDFLVGFACCGLLC